MADAGIDVENARLIIQLEIEDLEIAIATGPAHPALADRLHALHLQLQSLADAQVATGDQLMQRSMYTAMLSDHDAVGQAVREDADEDDAEGQQQEQVVGRRLSQPWQDDKLTLVDYDYDTTDLTEYMRLLSLDEDNPRRSCNICDPDILHKFTDTHQHGCGNVWCRGCLVEAFQNAVRNEANYPVTCCIQQASIDYDHPTMRRLLGIQLIAKYEAKAIEYSTTDRTYCHVPTCSAFIPPATITDRLAPCRDCQQQTCSTCKNAYHVHDNCEQPVEDEGLRAWREANAVPTCSRCHRAVEITHGCNHMSCHCGHEFCYQCSARWDTCNCPLWREDRLLARAEVLAVRREEPANVRAIMEELRDEDECRHQGRWTKVLTSTERCGDCRKRPGQWLWECQFCDTRLCRRCTRDYGWGDRL